MQVFDVMYVRRDSTRNSGVRAEGGLCPHQMFLENHARADERQDEGATQILHDVHANLKELDKRHAERTGVRWPECPRPVRLSRFSAGGRHPERPLSVVPAVSNAIMGAPALEFSTPAPRKSETAILESSLSSIRFAKMQVATNFRCFGPSALISRTWGR